MYEDPQEVDRPLNETIDERINERNRFQNFQYFNRMSMVVAIIVPSFEPFSGKGDCIPCAIVHTSYIHTHGYC